MAESILKIISMVVSNVDAEEIFNVIIIKVLQGLADNIKKRWNISEK